MKADTAYDAIERTISPVSVGPGSRQILKFKKEDASAIEGVRQSINSGVGRFISELRRRRVCRAITMYSVTLWLVCQMLDVASPALGLPDWTLKLVIVLGLLGLPIALSLSWLFEITPQGIVSETLADTRDAKSKMVYTRRPTDMLIDFSLVFVAVVIGAQLALGVLSRPILAQTPDTQRIAVLPFAAAAGEAAGPFAHSIMSELQHELSSSTHLIVVTGRELDASGETVSLTGTVSASPSVVRVTVTLFENKSGRIVWSKIVEHPYVDEIHAPEKMAKEIVAALPRQLKG